MKQYEFDKVIDRSGTNSLKYDFAVEHGLPADVLPMWVADMDFPAPEPVLEALQKAVSHGIFGYSGVKAPYAEALIRWFEGHFGWKPEPDWLVKTPGVVYAFTTAIRALTEPGEAVLITPPVYYPFFSAVERNGRKLVESPLRLENGRYSMDFRDFEEKIRENDVKLFLLCSPHNPVGRVWTEEELQTLGEICKRHGVIVVSDEIHCDFTMPGHPHTVFLKANPDMAEQALVCTAPSKTFNLAGLQTSNIWIPNAGLRRSFQEEMGREGVGGPNLMGLVGCQAAYEQGGEWLEQCKAYLRGNLDFMRRFLAERLPELKLVEPEGTYFAWVDFSALGLDKDALNDLIINRAKLWLDGGHIFGGNAELFQRFVLACPRKTLERALLQLEGAIRAEKCPGEK